LEEVIGSIPIRSTNIPFKISQLIGDTAAGNLSKWAPILSSIAFALTHFPPWLAQLALWSRRALSAASFSVPC
jgi:hypothetical protein